MQQRLKCKGTVLESKRNLMFFRENINHFLEALTLVSMEVFYSFFEADPRGMHHLLILVVSLFCWNQGSSSITESSFYVHYLYVKHSSPLSVAHQILKLLLFHSHYYLCHTREDANADPSMVVYLV